MNVCRQGAEPQKRGKPFSTNDPDGDGLIRAHLRATLVRWVRSKNSEIRPIYPLWVMVDFLDGDIMAL